jgi:uncharacterized protein (TIRG00374 family)
LLKGRAWKPLVLSLIVATAALYLTFRKTDWSELFGTFGDISLLPLLAILPLLTLSYICRIQRWKVLIGPISKVTFNEACAPLLTGFMVNSLLPGRVGEVLRALLLSRKTGVPRAASFATVVLARLFDGLTLSAMTLCLLGVMWNVLGPTVRTGLIAATVLYLVILTILVLLRKWRERVTLIIIAPFRWTGMKNAATWLERLLLSFAGGLEVLRNRAEVLVVSILSLCVWGCLIAAVVPVFLSMGLVFHWYYPILVLVLAGFGMLIPTPAGTGTVHYALGVVFPAITGVDGNSAKVMAIVFHATQFLPIIVVGLIAALKEGVTAGTVENLAESDDLEEIVANRSP